MKPINYMRLLVHPTSRHDECGTYDATVIACGRDLFGSLELAVALLGQLGWAVDDLKEFRLADSPADVESSEGVEELFDTALREGCACQVKQAAEGFAGSESRLDGISYSDVRAVRLLGL
jgi:hypothetical protein